MNFDLIAQWIAGLTFREAIWLFPFAFTLHVLEEVRQFTAWANRYASPQFTFQRICRATFSKLGKSSEE
jgi:hypothetical protein